MITSPGAAGTGAALAFAGDDGAGSGPSMIARGYDHALHDITVAAWVKLDAAARGQQHVIAAHGTTGDRGWLMLVDERGRPVFRSTAKTGGAAISSAIGNRAIDDGNWHFVVGVRQALTPPVAGPGTGTGLVSIYVDGAAAGPAAFFDASAAVLGGSLFHVGRRPAGLPRAYWRGLIDELSVYPVALSSCDIAQLHDAP